LKNLIVFVFFITFSFSCDGNCVSCHPKLVKNGTLDQHHAILDNCKTCHSKEALANVNMGASCGKDCWECHSVKKVASISVPEHLVLPKCIECHKKLKNVNNLQQYLDQYNPKNNLMNFLREETKNE
jgi:hypothetical protein